MFGVSLVDIAHILLVFFAVRWLSSQISTSVEQTKAHTTQLANKLSGMVPTLIHSMDRPAWVKVASTNPISGHIEFRMYECNDAFAKVFRISREEIMGKTDFEMPWDLEVARKFYDNDLEVYSTGEPATYKEITANGREVRVRKLRLQDATGRVKGVMGYGIECMAVVDPDSNKTCLIFTPGMDDICQQCQNYKTCQDGHQPEK